MCRASLSPWFERGGTNPADEDDVPVFEGRVNLGAISLHAPMILAKARQENRDFYEVLDYYLELIRNLHKKTISYFGEKKDSTNLVMFLIVFYCSVSLLSSLYRIRVVFYVVFSDLLLLPDH